MSPPATLAAFIKTECLSSSRAEPHSASHRGIAMIKQQGSHSALPGLCCQAGLARAPSLPLLSELICCCWHQPSAPRQPWPRPGRRQLCTHGTSVQRTSTHCHYHTRYPHPHHQPASHTPLLPDPCTLQATAVLQPRKWPSEAWSTGSIN